MPNNNNQQLADNMNTTQKTQIMRVRRWTTIKGIKIVHVKNDIVTMNILLDM